jgi:transglutaminase-like putative cysteine protease
VRQFILLLLILVPTLAFGAPAFTVAPAPKWTDRVSVDINAKAEARFGMYALLDDHQVRGGASTAHYYRRVRKVVSPSGVQNASEVTIDFDPSFERLVLHGITVIRDGRAMNALDTQSIRIIEKEDEKSDHLYDGVLSAIAFLKDVRPGDVLDYSWSIEGANPLLGGRFADVFDLTSDIPTHLIRQRLIFPASRPLRSRSTARDVRPSVTRAGDDNVYIWTRTNVAPLDVEDGTPDWFDAFDHVQVSEFASWHDVALWADALFQMNDASRAAVREIAEKIRKEHPSQREQLVAAIRFVQDDIRYLGIEMGRNSHEPHQPADVLEQRWGDCKDKSFLLAAILRDLGVDAYPAMVNTKRRRSMDNELPSPFEFDHVITNVVANGQAFWIDPTLADQGGTLESIETPNDERALVVRKEATALSTIVTNTRGATTIERTYTSKTWDGPTSLVVRSIYSGGDADALRGELASMTVADLAKERINKLAADQPKIRADAAPQIRDDRDRNVITVIERYTVRDLWRDGSFSYKPHAIEGHLDHPDTVIRSMPLSFDFPLTITERATFHLPEAVETDAADEETTSGAFRYAAKVVHDGNSVTIEQSLRATRDSIAAADVPEHLVHVKDILDGAAVTLTRTKGPKLANAAAATGSTAALAIVVILIAVAGRRRLRRG